MLDRIPSILKNKYVLVLIAALIWFLFFDQNNFIQQYRLSREMKNLENERDYFIMEIARDSTQIERLKNDTRELERYAREKYLMKKEGEDIFIIED